MPAPVQTIINPIINQVEVALEPANNALHSLMLLVKSDDLPGLDPWIGRTLNAMSDGEIQTNKLVMLGLHHAVLPDRSWPSFPTYLDFLENVDPFYIRDLMLDTYFKMPCQEGDPQSFTSTEDVLRSSETYIRFLKGRFGEKHIDVMLENQAYTYVINPTAMKLLLVSHLHNMWDHFLASEWERTEPLLKASVAAFQEIDLDKMTRLEAAEFVTGQSLSDAQWTGTGWLERADRVVFMPSAHIGPYFGQFKQGRTMGLVFGARLPEGSTILAPDLSRQEIVVRLNALADDTRLQIMRLIHEKGELNSQDIMQDLLLSQSAASRHLQQLSANGFLSERRCDGAKCYTINEKRLGDTLQAVSMFLTGNPNS